MDPEDDAGMDPALAPYVRSIVVVRRPGPGGRARVVPTGNATLMVNLRDDSFRPYVGADDSLGGAILAGPRSRAMVVEGGADAALLCVAFAPGAAGAFLPLPLSELTDRAVDLREVLGPAAAVLRERVAAEPTDAGRFRVAEEFLRAHLDVHRVPGFVPHAAERLAAGARVSATADAVGIAEWRFTQRFRETVGLTPKRYARIRRLEQVLAAGSDWARAAYEHGFCDQSHLVNEFRALLGVTPRAFRPVQDFSKTAAS
jgi:AraC-like DNA-binding protein